MNQSSKRTNKEGRRLQLFETPSGIVAKIATMIAKEKRGAAAQPLQPRS
jgi:hypothetical protein